MGDEKYYCAFVRQDKRWVELCQFNSRYEAENVMNRMLNKDNRYHTGNLRVMSRSEVRQEFGAEWVRIYMAYA
jgi:crotonobetainyl-CoA:carnitine CoA-transferase CaiB-like acyl-CoA transferase